MTIVFGEDNVFTDSIGKTYGIAPEKIEEHSQIVKLSGQSIIDLNVSDVLVSEGTTAATIVGENQAKTANTATFKKVKKNTAKVVHQVRHSLDELEKENGLAAAIAQTMKMGDISAARAIDNLVLHGTNAANGSPIENDEGVFVNSWLTKEAINQPLTGSTPEEVDAALWGALGEIETNGEGHLDNFLFDNRTFFTLPRNSVADVIPGFQDFRNPNYAGIPVLLTKRLAQNYDIEGRGSSGDTTGVVALAGDYSRIRVGVKTLGENPELIYSGDPDNTGRDLKGHNQFLVRIEYRVTYVIDRPEAFVKVVSAEEAGE